MRLVKSMKDPGSAITHLIGLILLYAASSAYHSFDICDKVNRRLKKFDHMMISILIAGTYTPICLLALERKVGGILYTVGGVIYALKLSLFNNRHKYFGSHEIFHLFVMGGSFCHYVVIYGYVI